ncbi:hypothetical protein C8J57DRAFT_1377032 [Mycena rebaudengoi]|nr:hypothetical protein C8J57DRAFT_1377032 [Mycena rebaudengoi]
MDFTDPESLVVSTGFATCTSSRTPSVHPEHDSESQLNSKTLNDLLVRKKEETLQKQQETRLVQHVLQLTSENTRLMARIEADSIKILSLEIEVVRIQQGIRDRDDKYMAKAIELEAEVARRLEVEANNERNMARIGADEVKIASLEAEIETVKNAATNNQRNTAMKIAAKLAAVENQLALMKNVIANPPSTDSESDFGHVQGTAAHSTLALNHPQAHQRQYKEPQPTNCPVNGAETSLSAVINKPPSCHICRKRTRLDDLLTCHARNCNKSAHVSCWGLPPGPDVFAAVKKYEWLCCDCKVCEMCDGAEGEGMLMCDACDRGWHMHCLAPPVEEEPPGEWFCPICSTREPETITKPRLRGRPRRNKATEENLDSNSRRKRAEPDTPAAVSRTGLAGGERQIKRAKGEV